MVMKADIVSSPRRRVQKDILGVRVDVIGVEAAIKWITEGDRFVPRYVIFANVQTVMECRRSQELREAVNRADLITADGTSIAWCLKWLGISNAECVDGPTLTPLLLERAAMNGIPVGFYGSSEHTLQRLLLNVHAKFPSLRVAYSHSPPFSGEVSRESDTMIQRINDTGIGLLFVGLGCPKQERWMSLNSDFVSCTMLGVGAVFDFLAGEKKMAPKRLQRAGLTWLFRLVQEPRRLWRRNLAFLPKFIVLFITELISRRIVR